jgi:hypothetical protein
MALPNLWPPTRRSREPRTERIPRPYPAWWERLRAVVGLAALNALLGLLIAIAIGVVVFLIVFAFDLAISS